MRNRKTGVKDVIDKFGVPPGKVTDIFALSGDSIDNIPGVRGIGEKTAKELIGKFGSLNDLFENVDKISKRQKKLIEENNLINCEEYTPVFNLFSFMWKSSK